MSSRLMVLLMAPLLAASPGWTAAQTDASLGVGIGTVRFPGNSPFGVVSLSPSLQVLGPAQVVELGGTLGALGSGDGYAQGRLSTWVSSGALAGRWHLALEGRASGVTTGSGEGSAAGQFSAEALWAAPRWGLAAATGPAVGWVTGDPAAVTAWRARFRGWWQNLPGRLQLAGSVEPNWFLGSRFTDFSAGVAARSPRLEVGLSGSARLKTDTLDAAALATVELRMSRRVTFEVAAGNVLSDPYQALPASRFLTIGVRFHFSPRTSQPDVVVRSKSFSAFRRGNEVLVRVRQRDAQLVAIAGDWNGWTPEPLERVGGDLWEASYPLGPGPHQFTVFIDGVAWTIPEGVPSVPDGMGGRVAVLSVF